MNILREEIPGQIWVHQRPLWFGGVKIRSRSTIVRLKNGELWVHSPAPPDDDLRRELDGLGDVRWIVVPNKFHHLEAPALKSKYPQAEVIGPSAARQRNPSLELDHDLADVSTFADQMPEIRMLPLAGVPFLDETTFFHEPTGTLIAADLMMSGSPQDHLSWRWASRVFGPTPELVGALEAMLSLPLERVLVAHSDSIVEKPREQFAALLAFARRPRG
jgi:Domain of unknown function (DUF4336)